MWSIALAEAYALALRGRHAEALRLLDGLLESCTESEEPAAVEPILLAQARVLLARGSDEDRALARDTLAHIAEGLGVHAWSARLDLTHLAVREGRTSDAAHLLKRTLEGFRRSAEDLGPIPSRLAAVISGEVRYLQGAAEALPAETGACQPLRIPARADRGASHEGSRPIASSMSRKAPSRSPRRSRNIPRS